jgi:hypothetical protein
VDSNCLTLRNAKETRLQLVLSLVNRFLQPNFIVRSPLSSPFSGAGRLGLRVTSESETLDSWPNQWHYPETRFHHSYLCRDTPTTNPSSQMLETASDAISDLALSPGCYMIAGKEKQSHDDDLVGTFTQKVHDETWLLARQLWIVDKREPRFSTQQTDTVANETTLTNGQQSEKEAGIPMLLGNYRGRSRRRKPVAMPVTRT